MFLLQIKAPDGGLLYAETNLGRSFPEPLNTLTSCFFFILALYWIARLKGFNPRHAFLSVATWILLIGSIGGTVYHGLRTYPVFIPMDWVPILMLCALASGWFWMKLIGPRLAAFVVLPFFLLIELITHYFFQQIDIHLAINLNYALMGLMVLIPLLLFLMKNQFFQARWVLTALISFGIALFFRIADNWKLLSVGTHFLWHTFGALATLCMFIFIYKLNEGMRLVYSKYGGQINEQKTVNGGF